MKPPAQLSR